MNLWSYSIPYLPHNDIALVHVARNFEFSEKVQPIAFSKSEIPEDAILALTGFGQSKNSNSDVLQTINLRRISLKQCNPPTDPLALGESHLCTFNEHADQGICHGDRWERKKFDRGTETHKKFFFLKFISADLQSWIGGVFGLFGRKHHKMWRRVR